MTRMRRALLGPLVVTARGKVMRREKPGCTHGKPTRRRLIALLAFQTVFFAGMAVADVPVTLENFIRAETDGYFADDAVNGLGVWVHRRNPIKVEEQDVIRMNRDTLYSNMLLDLTTPATITLPDSQGRFMSMLVINQDHYDKLVAYDPGDYTLTMDDMGTRYVEVIIRTFVDPNNPDDVQAANALQDQLAVTQADPGTAEFPDWNQEQRVAIRKLLNQLAPYSDGTLPKFGDVGEVDPVSRLVFTAAGWGGNPTKAAIYVPGVVANRDGETAYRLTMGEVPVEGFWSVTVYNGDGYMEAPMEAASVNNVTAKRDADGNVTIHFGGDPTQPNYLRIMPDWTYTVRLYRPGPEILDGSWTVPAAVEVPKQ
ncbi:MAG: DUF1214 domain-containing protein [Rhodobacterales bacterium]|nr:DUF1214 domain-containing protein [Rhodobacterales bacterium]